MNLSKIRSAAIVILLLILTGSIAYDKGVSAGEKKVSVPVISGGDQSGEKNIDFSLFWNVWDRLQKNYLDQKAVDAQKMVYGAIKGMTASLDDPYTSFLPPADNTRTKEDLSGEFSGVGIQLGFIDKTLAVMSPLPDNPAIKAGIRAGDLILKIKDADKKVDKDTQGINLSDAMDLIRGQKGKSVTLTILHQGEQQTQDITMVRETINVPSVTLKWTNEGKTAWLQVSKFGDKTSDEWNNAVDQIVARRSKPGFKGIVLDLRNNPGGYLRGAVDLASEFIKSGVVVQQQGRDKTDKFEVSRQGRLIGTPMVVLVNQGSASASEILSGALRERLGIKLVGEKTFGKGTVQEAQELPGGAGLHVTIAKWLLPSGKNIHGDGLNPDVEVKYVPNAKDVNADNQLDKAVEVLGK